MPEDLLKTAVPRFGPAPLPDPPPDVEHLTSENERLLNELQHCRQQLDLVYTVSEQIGTVQEPAGVRRALLRQYAAMLDVGALYLDQGGACSRVPLGRQRDPRIEVSSGIVRKVLHSAIEQVRREGRAVAVARQANLKHAGILLGVLRQGNDPPAVIIALRHASNDPFEQADALVSDSVLTFGTQMLRNASLVRSLQHNAVETVCALVNAIDAKDNYTSDHSERVGWLARLTGEVLGLNRAQLQALEWAGLLHDVGKIGIAEHILNKPGGLDPVEYEQMRQHPRIGFEMLKPVARFGAVLTAVLYHHENHDGTGYPHQLSGEGIPLDARIIHVVDIFDALTTARPYRSSYSLTDALALLRRESGAVTDPQVTRAFEAALQRGMETNPRGFRTHFAHLLTAGFLPT